MNTTSVTKIVDICKLLADPTRLKILRLLFSATEEVCVNEIADMVGASQSATSHQLSKLELRGIVDCSRQGQSMCYRIVKNKLTKTIRNTIQTMR